MIALTSRRLWAALLAMCAMTAAGVSRASTVDLGSNGYYDNVVATASSPLAVWDFMATASGTVTLNVTDLQLGDLISALSTSIALFNGQKLQLDGTSSAVFEVEANQRFTTSLYALASGSKGWSAYNLSLSFVPKASPVPLPLGGWLLLSGCGLLAARVRRVRTNAGRATT